MGLALAARKSLVEVLLHGDGSHVRQAAHVGWWQFPILGGGQHRLRVCVVRCGNHDPQILALVGGDVPQLGGSTGNTFEIILYKDGRIVYQYLTVAAPATSSTTGTQLDATVGLQVAFNQAYLHDGLAVQLTQDAAWLSGSPTSGTIPPGGSANLAVTADPTRVSASEE